MMRFWQIIKSKFIEIIGDTRGEFRTSEADANEYVINGVRYIVSTRFSKTENKTMKEKLSEFIGGDFAHLTTTQDTNTINTEYVNSTAGERRTNADILAQKNHLQAELKKAIERIETVERLYLKLYEDNSSGKVTDEWFMCMSHKYEVERIELKAKVSELRTQIGSLEKTQKGKEIFIAAIRKFMQMETLTAPLLHELIDRIEVHEIEGTGKNRTQRIVIHYRFVGYLELPIVTENYKADTRQGVAIEYLTA